MDHLEILCPFVKKEIGAGERAVGLIIARVVVRDDDNGRWDHQSLDVSENLGTAAVSKRGIQDCDIRFSIQNHRGSFFRVRRFSHDIHAGNFLKTFLESLTKVRIGIGKDDGHVMCSSGLTVCRVMHNPWR